jgi:hypothetical protein
MALIATISALGTAACAFVFALWLVKELFTSR